MKTTIIRQLLENVKLNNRMDYLKFSITNGHIEAFVVDNLGSMACWAKGYLNENETNPDCSFHVNDIAKFLSIIKKLKENIVITNDHQVISINDGVKKVNFEKFTIEKLEKAYDNFKLSLDANKYTVTLPNAIFEYDHAVIVDSVQLNDALSFAKESRGSEYVINEDNYKLTVQSKLGLTVLTDTIPYLEMINTPPFPVTYSDYIAMIASKFKFNLKLLFTNDSKKPYAVEAKTDDLTYFYWMATKP